LNSEFKKLLDEKLRADEARDLQRLAGGDGAVFSLRAGAV